MKLRQEVVETIDHVWIEVTNPIRGNGLPNAVGGVQHFQMMKSNRVHAKLGKMRSAQLQRLLKRGDVGAACALMDKLVKRGATNANHRAMMRNHYRKLP